MDSSQPTADDPRPSPTEKYSHTNIVLSDKCAVHIVYSTVDIGCKGFNG